MSQWQNPPHPGFSVDPTVAPTLRPSTSDRDYADTTLQLAHVDGRLTEAELAERVERADSATSLGELNDLIADVTLPSAVGPDSRLLGPGSYYWPIWPMLGTAIPVIGLLAARVGPAPALPRRVDPPSDLR